MDPAVKKVVRQILSSRIRRDWIEANRTYPIGPYPVALACMFMPSEIHAYWQSVDEHFHPLAEIDRIIVTSLDVNRLRALRVICRLSGWRRTKLRHDWLGRPYMEVMRFQHGAR